MEYPKRIVITGLGSLTPIGENNHDYWQGLLHGKSGAAPITRFDASQYKTRFACELKQYDWEDHFDRKEIKQLDPAAQYALLATKEALLDGGYSPTEKKKENTGVIWGTGIGGMQSMQEEIVNFVKNDMRPRFNPFFIPKMIANMPAGQISIKYGFKGPNYVTVSACASASHAIINAVHAIQLGLADTMIAGGSEAAINPIGIGGFNVMRALSERNDDPSTASRPFDKQRDGFVLGEGAGALLLESLESAQRRGAKIYAEVIGTAMTAEAYHITAPHPEGNGALYVMQQAVKNAKIALTDVDYINVHGTSTPLGDVSEIKAIQTLFQEHAYKLNISATKSMIGHLLGAAGAVESIATVLSLHYDIIPPTINHFELDDVFDPRLNFTFNQPQNRVCRVAINNTFGFGGHNTSIIFKKWIN